MQEKASLKDRPYRLDMKTIIFALFVPLLALIVAQEIQVPFINSTGFALNSVPYSTRLYWMQQANQAVYNYSGPWSFRFNILLIAVPSRLLDQ
jgi:hypothetical protein